MVSNWSFSSPKMRNHLSLKVHLMIPSHFRYHQKWYPDIPRTQTHFQSLLLHLPFAFGPTNDNYESYASAQNFCLFVTLRMPSPCLSMKFEHQWLPNLSMRGLKPGGRSFWHCCIILFRMEIVFPTIFFEWKTRSYWDKKRQNAQTLWRFK